MNDNKIGAAISFLRKRAGYTQKDLADRIGISDKAVSKWERGLGLPDISYLRKLSILLDTDSDSLLAGDVIHHDNGWQGVLLLEKNVNGIGAGTIIYDKPLIHYLLSYFLLVGIRNVWVICEEEDKKCIDGIFGDGSEFGIRLQTHVGPLQEAAEAITLYADNIMMVYGRCVLYGVDQTRFFQKAMIEKDRFTMLVLPKKISHSSPRIVVDQNKRVIGSADDEPLWTQYDFSDIPILFFPARCFSQVTKRGDIGAFITEYASQNELYAHMLDRGFVDIEVDTWDNVQEASTFIKIIQDKCGMIVYCIEEVAWRRGMISLEQLRAKGKLREGTEYGEYILSLCERIHPTI